MCFCVLELVLTQPQRCQGIDYDSNDACKCQEQRNCKLQVKVCGTRNGQCKLFASDCDYRRSVCRDDGKRFHSLRLNILFNNFFFL